MREEGTILIRGSQGIRWEIQIEKIRCFGLVSLLIVLAIGKVITDAFVPEGLMNAGYIAQTFKFHHSCVYLDYNPSKTISALLVMFTIIPLDLFVILFHFKILYDHKIGKLAEDSPLAKYTPSFTPIMLVFFTSFFMVFVNHPDDNSYYGPPPSDPGSIDKSNWITRDYTLPYGFIAHYVPYMFMQTAMILLTIQHNRYLVETNRLERLGLTEWMMKIYDYAFIACGILYTIFVWSFIFDKPLWDTGEQPGEFFGRLLMASFVLFSVVLPAIYSAVEFNQFPEDVSVLVFYEAKE